MTDHRPRVFFGRAADLRKLVDAADLHDIVYCRETRDDFPPFIMVRGDDGKLCAQKLKRTQRAISWRVPGAWRVPRTITDQYRDAFSTFRDVCIWFAGSRGRLALELSPRDASLASLFGGDLPRATNDVQFFFGPAAKVSTGLIMFGNRTCDHVQEEGLWEDMIPLSFEGPTDGVAAQARRKLDVEFSPRFYLDLQVHEMHLFWHTDDTPSGQLPVPTLAPHWRLLGPGDQPRDAECALIVAGQDRSHEALLAGRERFMRAVFAGPMSTLLKQLDLVRNTVRPGVHDDDKRIFLPGWWKSSEEYLATDLRFNEADWRTDIARQTDERRYPWRWPSVSRRLVHAVAVLAQLEPRLSPYVMLWIVDRLPGAIYYPELRKLRCIEATADRIRAKLVSTTK
jgi:hypothetical protein